MKKLLCGLLLIGSTYSFATSWIYLKLNSRDGGTGLTRCEVVDGLAVNCARTANGVSSIYGISPVVGGRIYLSQDGNNRPGDAVYSCTINNANGLAENCALTGANSSSFVSAYTQA